MPAYRLPFLHFWSFRKTLTSTMVIPPAVAHHNVKNTHHVILVTNYVCISVLQYTLVIEQCISNLESWSDQLDNLLSLSSTLPITTNSGWTTNVFKNWHVCILSAFLSSFIASNVCPALSSNIKTRCSPIPPPNQLATHSFFDICSQFSFINGLSRWVW